MSTELVNGSTQQYGPVETNKVLASVPTTAGAIQQIRFPLIFDDLPSADNTDREDMLFIPANSVILRTGARVPGTAFAGGTSYNVGFIEKDGSVIDVDGLYAAVTLAQLNAGGTGIATEGALVGASVGTADAYLSAAATGSFTAGETEFVVEYIAPA
jgi:hypothetical protein